MKTDPRTRYTREIITSAFWQLLQQKPMEKITVKEVCTLAQINRGTFYRHFRDCYDLMEQLEEQALEQLEAALVSTRDRGVQAVLLSMLQKLQNDEDFLAVLARQSPDDAFLHRVVGCCFHYMDLRMAAGERTGADNGWRGMQNTFLFAGASGVMSYWLHSDRKAPPEQVAAAIAALCTGAAGVEPPTYSL